MRFVVKERPLNIHTWKTVDQLPSRVKAVIRQLPIDIARMVLDELDESAPDGIEDYPDMLDLRRFTVPGVDSVVGVVVPKGAQSRSLRMQDAGETVIYVIPVERRTGDLSDAGASILAEHNPWTMDSLPYEPTHRQATLMTRKVSRREVSRITARRKSEVDSVVSRLKKEAGIDPKRQHSTMLRRRVTRDVAFEVMRREFGVGGKHDAHWRPAIGKARRKFISHLMQRKFIRWLAVPSEMRWKKRDVVKLEKTSVRRFARFQELVASGGS